MGGRAALVLAGGGISGAGWEMGMLAGLAEVGVDLTTADVIIGTSAGSVVGAQITSGMALEELYARQLREPVGEIPVKFGLGSLGRIAALILLPGDETMRSARIGRAALRARTMSESTRRQIIAGRLPVDAWPDRDLRITAVDALTGELVLFTRDSGVSLVDAVTASCAVPLVYPPATINGKRYIDGGVRSGSNADLAVGCDPVVVLTPSGVAMRRSLRPDRLVARLGSGVRSIVVTGDEAARKAMGTQALDPSRRAPSARAGRAQAQFVAAAVDEVWSSARVSGV